MRYAVDSQRQAMAATGIVNAAMAWEETPEGKRRPSKTNQERNENTGMPLWEVEVTYRTSAFGRESTATAMVRVGAADKPEPEDFSQIKFTFLEVEVRTNKAGGITEIWTAEEVDQMTTAKTVANGKAEAPADKSASKSAA